MILIKPGYSNYDKVFFDHDIKLVDGKILELSKYSDHVVLLVKRSTPSSTPFTDDMSDMLPFTLLHPIIISYSKT